MLLVKAQGFIKGSGSIFVYSFQDFYFASNSFHMKKLLWFIPFLMTLLPGYGQVDPGDWCSRGKMAISAKSYFEKARQTENQHDYDVHFYSLALRLIPGEKKIEGRVKIAFQVIEDSIDRIELDLTENYSIEKIVYEDEQITFSHEGELLTIELGQYVLNGSEAAVEVFYHGHPQSAAFNFDEREGKPLIWSLSEPYGARSWWPCKDYPFDKADSAQIQITVPEDLKVGSNGKLVAEWTEEGWTTFLWKEQYPITTYLISVAAHPYQIEKDFFHFGEQDSMEVLHYIYPDHFEEVVEDYAKTIDMLEFYSESFGLYPFIEEKYGHAEFPWGGGMEHQTLTSLLGPYEYLIAHEMAHQWWGNMITCKDFHHIWLNEGFATYAEALWAEQSRGVEAYHDYMADNAFYGEGSIYVPDLSNDGRIFSGSLSYNKASWVLHMLRHVVGDAVFFDILKAYGDSSRKYGVATTEQFRDLCEEVSGKELDYFFEQWIYQENHPIYAYEWQDEKVGEEYELNLTIAQEQAFPIFRMPIDVVVEMENRDTLLLIENHLSVQDYSFRLPEKALSVRLDPDNWILKKVLDGRALIHHNNNSLILSLSDHGSLGFDVPNGNGNGLIYPKGGDNLLYFGSAVVGIGDEYLLDTDIASGNTKFLKKQGTQLIFEEKAGEQKGYLQYTDEGSEHSRGLLIEQSSYTYVDDVVDEAVILDYVLKNEGNADLEGVYFALLLDLDIGYYLDNTLGYSLDDQLIFQENGIFSGIKALGRQFDDRLHFTAIQDALSHFSGKEKWAYLTGETNDYQENVTDDWAIMLSVGPLEIKAGDSENIPLALICASDRDEIISHAKSMQDFYDLMESSEDLSEQVADISPYPNPVRDKLQLDWKNVRGRQVHFVLVDVLGRKRFEKTLKKNSADRYELDLSAFPEGIYFLQCRSGNQSTGFMLLKR
jgi:aminopeptidase N